MKVVYFYPTMHFPGGMERVLTIKLNYLADKLNYKVYLITYRQKGRDNFFKLSSNVTQINLDLKHFYGIRDAKKIKKVKKSFFKTYKEEVKKILFNIKADYCISTLFGEEYKFLNEIKDGSKKIAEYHFSFQVSRLNKFKNRSNGFSINSLKNKYYYYQELKTLKSFDQIILLTKKDMTSWGEYLNNISFINNPITISINNEIASLDNKRIIAIGRLSYQKGFDLLIESWNFIANDNPDWKLDIYGDGELKLKIEEKVKELNLQKSVTINPPSDKIHEKLLEASIFVLSSRFEGLPLVLMESMYFGLPAVSFDCDCGPSDLIEDGVSGFLIENNNVKLFANKMEELMLNKEQRKSFGVYAKHLSNKYNVDIIMEQWDTFFKNKN